MTEKIYPVPGTQSFIPGTEIEIVNPDLARGSFKYALFDFDGTVSLMREGWQRIMLPVMVDSIRGETPSTPEIVAACEEYIEESTGIQTVLQMEHLVEMVREFGFVPEDQILDAKGYKQVYNDRLMVPVNERIAKVDSGELSLDDVTVRGSREFVKNVFDRDLTIYIASGTDQDDVRNETAKCQIDQWCKGGIFGAIGNVEEYSKDRVIKGLLADFGLHGSELFVVGDGPVEIKNAKSNGAVSIGVASDEVAGFGWNMHKRDRLIRSGADIMVADFGEYEKLAAYLFGEI
jgi:phosphoglycolate phosphatase-like HAD superfamily hydrolase